MELILGILGLLCALYFALLVSIGMDFSWIWLVGAVLFWGIAAVHKYTVLHSIVIAKGLKIAVITVFAIGLLVFVIAEGCIVSQMSAEPKEDLDYMIVLGAQVHGERPSRALKLRLEKAAQEWECCGKPTLLLSGGQGDGESITEAECMKRFLVEKGIPKDKMILEDESVSTMENLQFCARLSDCKKKEDRDRQQQFSCLSCPETCEKAGLSGCLWRGGGLGLAVSDPLHGAGSLCTGQRKDQRKHLMRGVNYDRQREDYQTVCKTGFHRCSFLQRKRDGRLSDKRTGRAGLFGGRG